MQLKLWDLLRRFDATTEEATRKQILQSLCDDYLHFNFDHQKPQLRDGIKTEHEESSQDEDESRNTINQDIFDFSNQKLIQTETHEMDKDLAKFKLTTNVEQAKKQTLQRISQFLSKLLNKGDGIWHELDFGKYDAEAVFMAAVENRTHLASIKNQSLLAQIVNGITAVRSVDPAFVINPSFLQAFTIEQLDKLKALDSWLEKEDNFVGTYF